MPEMLYQQQYVWFVFLATLDILVTSIVLHSGGVEVNWLAAAVLRRHDLVGLVEYKFALVALMVVLIENIGRAKPDLGRKMIRLAIILTAAPVVLGLGQLLLAVLAHR